jgi:transcriptional repressor NF-X1
MKCDDECLRLDRNRRLAAALNIDPSAHVNDHVPYSDETLSFFQDNQAWAETQEREFRVFASTPSEVRLRYKPMPSHQREFLHLLAKDFGLESRSEEPEPQRYVVVYKGSRFVSAPSKTLAQCVKIRAKQAAEAAAVAEASRPPSPPAIVVDPYNAYLLISPRFGLTAEEITAALQADLSSQPSIRFKIDFLPATDEVLIRATTNYSAFLTPSALEQALATLKSRLAITVSKNKLAGAILLCHVDDNNEISRKENLVQNSTSGWSAVAGRAASRKPSPMSEDGAAKAPGRKLLGLKKKKVEKEKESTWSALSGDVEC